MVDVAADALAVSYLFDFVYVCRYTCMCMCCAFTSHLLNMPHVYKQIHATITETKCQSVESVHFVTMHTYIYTYIYNCIYIFCLMLCNILHVIEEVCLCYLY